AANEMKERLTSFNCEADKMLISTIHSMCARFLRIDGATLGYGQNFTIYSEQDADRVIKRILDSMQMNRDDKDKLKKNCMRVISDAKNELVNLDKLDEFVDDDDIDIIKEVAKKYTEQLHKSNAMDFDDLLVNTYRMFATNSDILNKYQDHYRYISVDEFQDTNKVQYEIFKLLAQKYGNLFVVGDDDQSIYGWRGANVENILNFKDDYPTAQVFKLEQNYRSTKKILSVANTIISKNTDRYEKTLWTDNSDGVRTEQFSGYTEKDESNYVIQQILGLMSRGTYSFSDFAILMRVNALSRTFEQACLQYQIPNKVFGGFKFFERAEIKDILAYLRMLDNSYDNEATLRIINVPKRGIGESTCKKLSELSADNGISIIELLSDERNLESFNRGTVIKLLGFYSIYAQLLEYKKILNLVDLVKQVVSITRYRTALLEDEEEGKALNLDELVESAQEFVNDNPDSDLSTFLQSVSLYSDLDKEDGNFVTLGTVHSVKGLEFKVVFVVGLDEGLFPLSRATYSAKEMQEERRLMYVA
ncbi:MAG: 3'-5' exonuclease, partial [Clostridia bacterium]